MPPVPDWVAEDPEVVGVGVAEMVRAALVVDAALASGVPAACSA